MDDKNHNRQFGFYYQAQVDPKMTWFFVGVLRSFEHMVFDRTYDVQRRIFEFFVPEDTEKHFLDLMDYFKQEQIVQDLEKKENRLIDPHEVI